MLFHDTYLPGVVLIEPQPHRDERGFFLRVLSADLFAEAGIDHTRFVQENQSRSAHRTLRGMHLRAAPGEAKTVRCARGRIFDVVADLRPQSPTFGSWESFILDDERHLQLYIPRGCAHGFQVLSAASDVCYRHDAFYDPALERAVAWNDPELAIEWPLADPLLSDRDRAAPALDELREALTAWFGDLDPTAR